MKDKKQSLYLIAAIVLFAAALIIIFSIGSCKDETADASGDAQQIAASDYAQAGSDLLPDELVGTWTAFEVYQDARATDVTPDDGLLTEQNGGIDIDYIVFSHNETSVDRPVYSVVRGADASVLAAAGIQTDGVAPDCVIDVISVKASADSPVSETVYLVDGDTLIAYGAGGHVYAYAAVEAVG